MSKRSLIILVVSLMIILYSMNTIYADDGWNTGGSTKYKYYEWHELNGTIVGKHNFRGFIDYLVKINGETFYLDSSYQPYGEFYVGDNVTMNGNTYYTNTEIYGYTYGKQISNEFGGAYKGKTLHYLRLDRYKNNGKSYGQMRLADGFVRSGSSSSTNKASGSMSILNGTFITGSGADDKTKCTIYVGKEYAGKNIKISVLYSRDGKNLNQGLKVDKEVSSSGEITVYSKDPFEKYPDKAKITIYSYNGKKIDTTVVTLAENSKPQPFDFSSDSKPRKEDPKYASNGAKFIGYAGDGSWANYYKNGQYYTVDGELIG